MLWRFATANNFLRFLRRKFCGANLAQKGAKNPRKRKQFLRFCAAIPPQIFAHGNPSGGPDTAMVTLVIGVHVHSNLFSSTIHGPV